MNKFFGTDGVRGIVGKKITPSLAFNVGKSLTYSISSPRIIVGRDTRQSGETILHSFVSGVLAGGGSVVDIGVCPSPAISFLVSKNPFDYGVVITASHNPAEHNGIKVFNTNGHKLSDEHEAFLEKQFSRRPSSYSGTYEQNTTLLNDYINMLTSGEDLHGLRIVLDCSNGAAVATAPESFKQLGAEVVVVGCSPNGTNINENCGCLYIENLVVEVLKNKADMGFAFDGDADRIIAVDARGEVLNGDSILYILAKYLPELGFIVVGNLYTNSEIERQLYPLGISVIHTKVGDKYIVEKMLKTGAVLGGENSGHIIMFNKNSSGDGVLTAITLAQLVHRTYPLHVLNDCTLFPNKMVSISLENKSLVQHVEITEMLQNIPSGYRTIVRPSGTENVVRLFCEGPDIHEVENILDRLCEKLLHLDTE